VALRTADADERDIFKGCVPKSIRVAASRSSTVLTMGFLSGDRVAWQRWWVPVGEEFGPLRQTAGAKCHFDGGGLTHARLAPGPARFPPDPSGTDRRSEQISST
jgi:hypothetical protein